MAFHLRKHLLRLKALFCPGIMVANGGNAVIRKDVVGDDNVIVVGRGSVMMDVSVRIRGNGNRIVFEDNCHVGPDCSFWMEGNGITIVIGEGTTFTSKVHFCAQEDGSSVMVGKDCMFANTITVRTSDSHPVYDGGGDRINPPGPVVIGEHVWIAPGVRVMKGVSLGDGCIIGAGSIVTKNVPDRCMAVGIPAKVVKEGVRWTREHLF